LKDVNFTLCKLGENPGFYCLFKHDILTECKICTYLNARSNYLETRLYHLSLVYNYIYCSSFTDLSCLSDNICICVLVFHTCHQYILYNFLMAGQYSMVTCKYVCNGTIYIAVCEEDRYAYVQTICVLNNFYNYI
jgi:hypothetical protein